MNADCGQNSRAASEWLKVPPVFTSKSSNARDAAKSWFGCAAQWTIALGLIPSLVCALQRDPARRCRNACRDKPVSIPSHITGWTKEIGAHIVVDATHPASDLGKIGDRLRSYEAARSGYQQGL
jgi:hypothetical protein